MTSFEEHESSSQPSHQYHFPPMSTTLAQVLEVVAHQAPLPDTEALTKIVEHDPATATFVLRRANSAYYGLRSQVAAISRAVDLLGFREVSNLVLTAGVLEMTPIFKSPEHVKLYQKLSQHSILTGFFSVALANHLDIDHKNLSFTAGLLHQLGRMVLLTNEPFSYAKMWFTEDGSSQFTVPPADKEALTFGLDHLTLGATIAEKWNLPEILVATIENYQNPTTAKGFNLLAGCVAAAQEQSLAILFPTENVTSDFPLLNLLAQKTNQPAENLHILLSQNQDEGLSFAQNAA